MMSLRRAQSIRVRAVACVLLFVSSLPGMARESGALYPSRELKKLQGWFRLYSRKDPRAVMEDWDSPIRRTSSLGRTAPTLDLAMAYRRGSRSAEVVAKALATEDAVGQKVRRSLRAYVWTIGVFSSAPLAEDRAAMTEQLVLIMAYLYQGTTDARFRPDLVLREALKALARMNDPETISSLIRLAGRRSVTSGTVSMSAQTAAAFSLDEKLRDESLSDAATMRILQALRHRVAQEPPVDSRLRGLLALVLERGLARNPSLPLSSDWDRGLAELALRVMADTGASRDLVDPLLRAAVGRRTPIVLKIFLEALDTQEVSAKWRMALWEALEGMAPPVPERSEVRDTNVWFTWLQAAKVAAKEPPLAQKSGGKAESGSGPVFRGIPLVEDVVFVVDTGHPVVAGVLERVKRELSEALDKLPQESRFNIITVGDGVESLLPRLTVLRGHRRKTLDAMKPVEGATDLPRNVSSVVGNISQGRRLAEGILLALGFPQRRAWTAGDLESTAVPDQIVLVSDGTSWGWSPQDLIDRVLLLNRIVFERTGRVVRIDSVIPGEGGPPVLGRLARENWGAVGLLR